jgi:hypothetical protein
LLLALAGNSFGQTSRPRNLNSGVDTTRQADVMLAVVHVEVPATVNAGEQLAGRLVVQNVGRESLEGTYRARLVYESRDTYREQMQDLGTLTGKQLPPGVPVEKAFSVAVPAGLPMKFEGPPGLFPLGKVNVLGKTGRKKKRVVFFGDSVTQEAPLPDGYVIQDGSAG